MPSLPPPLPPQHETVAVCTIEKANMAINRMVLEGRLHELVCVVVDEAHMVTDPERGLALEVGSVVSDEARTMVILSWPGTHTRVEASRIR